MAWPTKLLLVFLLIISAPNVLAAVTDEQSFREAIDQANQSASPSDIEFSANTYIALDEPIVYTGTQNLCIQGNHSTIEASSAGSFTANDATLLFSTKADITIRNLTLENNAANATHGIRIQIPGTASGSDINVILEGVSILNSQLHGLYVDDSNNSAVGINLSILNNTLIEGNGKGGTDFDGVRVDETGPGGITATITHSVFQENGGDGIELDERGPGNVELMTYDTAFNANGFYDSSNLEDGIDIDEMDDGNVSITANGDITLNDNYAEGLDLDEAGNGSVIVNLTGIKAHGDLQQGIQIDEADEGDLEAHITNVDVQYCGNDGLQLSEVGEGLLQGELTGIKANYNDAYGIKLDQRLEKNIKRYKELSGNVNVCEILLIGNTSGDSIETSGFVNLTSNCGCSNDWDCDDGVICNGLETCVDSRCEPGIDQCQEGETCDEVEDKCVSSSCLSKGEPCSENSDCCQNRCLKGFCKK